MSSSSVRMAGVPSSEAGGSVEVSIDLKPRYREAAERAYEQKTLQEVNQKLAPLGVHLSFRSNNEPRNEKRPQEIVFWADAN